MMDPTVGPLILMVNDMIKDVARWLIIQLIFLIGFTSALYAIAGDPLSTTTGVYLEGERRSVSTPAPSPTETAVWAHADACSLRKPHHRRHLRASDGGRLPDGARRGGDVDAHHDPAGGALPRARRVARVHATPLGVPRSRATAHDWLPAALRMPSAYPRISACMAGRHHSSSAAAAHPGARVDTHRRC